MPKVDPATYMQVCRDPGLALAVRAFFMVESGEEAEPPYGDMGQAWGPGQQHAAFFKEYYGGYPHWPASVYDTVVVSQIKTCVTFLYIRGWVGATVSIRDLLVQAYNLGYSAVFKENKRNPEYLMKWLEAYNQIVKGKA